MAFLKKYEVRIWDALFFLFLFLPLATGGLWFRNERIKLEITQLGPAALVLGLWLWAGRRRELAGKSIACRLVSQLWRRWEMAIQNRPAPALIGAWIFFGMIWFGAAWSKHQGFRSGAFDLGIFTNAIWNLAETGVPFSSLKGGVSLFSDHQSFVIYPISWIFRLAPGPGILLFLQSIALTGGALALFLLGRQRLAHDNLLLPFLPFLYWMYFPTRAANVFDFHPEVLMLPAFLFAVWGLQEKKAGLRLLGFLFFLFAMAAKESGGPVAAGIGLAWICGAGPAETQRFTRPLGILAVFLGVSLFLFDTKFVPQFFGVAYGYGEVYAPFGSSLSSLALAPFRFPKEFFLRLLGGSRLKFLFQSLLPLAFLPLFSPLAFVAALPGLAMLFLSAGEQRLSLGYHYAIEPSVGFFLALIATLALPALAARESQKKWLLILTWLLLFTYGRSEIFHWRFYQIQPSQKQARDEILPRLNPALSVAATSSMVAHISTRRWVNQLPLLQLPTGQLVDCVVWDRSLNNSPLTENEEAALEKKLKQDYLSEFAGLSTQVFALKNGNQKCLVN